MPKICPQCHNTYEAGKFCLDCGVQLIEQQIAQQPSEGGFKLNLGDANVISGGVNMSDNHSVNNNTVNTTTSNVDSHNVITNNITQVERKKTPEELKHDKELAFREACIEAYSSGILTSDNKRKLDDMQYRLGITESSASRILSEVAKRTERKSSALSPVHQITYNNIKTAINNNRLDLVSRLMAQMKAMVQRYSVEEIQFTYYMLQAILHPKECTEEYEKPHEDKYWQTFWSSIAYRSVGNVTQSELLVSDIGDKWIDTIPQENVFILATVNAVIDDDIETAKSLYDNINGEHSVYLSNLVSCLYTLFYSDMLSSEQLKQMQKEGAFYLNNLFSVTTLMSEKKRIQEEAEIKRIAEEKRQKEEAESKRIAEEKRLQEEADAKRLAEEKRLKEVEDQRIQAEKEATKAPKSSVAFDIQELSSYQNKFGYLRNLSESDINKLKSVLSSVSKDNYQVQFCLGQLYLQENKTAANQRLAYNCLKNASEHGVYEAGAFMAYFYLYGKVVKEDLNEAERRIKIDDDYKKNPIFVQMLIDLYTKKGNEMLADVWKTKLSKLK